MVMRVLDCRCLLHFAFLSVSLLVLKTHLDLEYVLIHGYLISISLQALLLNKIKFTILRVNVSFLEDPIQELPVV